MGGSSKLVRSPELYQIIALIRRFEERAIELVRSGEIASGIHPCIGQEGVAAGLGAALRRDDVLYSNHRAHGHLLAKGTDPGVLLAEMAGRVNGVDRGRGGSFHPSDFSVGVYGCTGSVGHGAPMAVGTAWALARQGSDRVAVATFGDGAIGQGALLESLNLAALWQAPVVFVCENNGYATTLPVGRALAGSVTARALACGIPAATHDGMDAEVVYAAAAEAVERARAGGGPVFLEFLTYRFEGHHTFEAKAGLRYRSPAEVAGWRGRDPLTLQASRVGEEERLKIDAWADSVVEDAVRFAVAGERPSPDTAFDHLYSTEPRPYRPDPHAAVPASQLTAG
ncbi:MAG: thiamine pyrophosphate-dependent dehydrogenase E1 component subunit alpha [Streptosporangiaceae bacterium]|nr:thiamine pyrophosphate-dependent dehydrogenase E1 component subunit alpha [Streptosporangiaceae bacterium]